MLNVHLRSGVIVAAAEGVTDDVVETMSDELFRRDEDGGLATQRAVVGLLEPSSLVISYALLFLGAIDHAEPSWKMILAVVKSLLVVMIPTTSRLSITLPASPESFVVVEYECRSSLSTINKSLGPRSGFDGNSLGNCFLIIGMNRLPAT